MTPSYPPEQILVGTDFSEQAERAFAYAARMAADTGARLHVAFIGMVSLQLMPFGAEGSWRGAGDWSAEQKAAAELRLAELISSLDSDIDASMHYVEGPAAAMLTELAIDYEVDLLVVGSHGRTGVGRALLGSVAERTVRHAPCAVLVVR